MREFTVHAEFDAEAGVWLGSNEDLPLTTEAPSLDALLTRILEIAPEIAVMNGLTRAGEALKIHLIANQVTAAAV